MASDIKIDESKHKESPGLFRRLWDAIVGVIEGFILLQITFTFGFRSGFSTIILYKNPLFIGYLIFCLIMGWIYGYQFHGWLKKKMEEWNLWGWWY